MNNNNILIIVKDMLPYIESFGACQRMHYLANSLCKKGCSVTVVSEKKANGTKC